VLLEPGTLGFGSRGERLKVEAADPAETSSFQSKPERALALDADGEAFQLDKARQGRVTPQFTIQLQSPELLSQPRRRNLWPRWGDPDLTHQPLKRAAILLDLRKQDVRKEAAERGVLVLARGAPNELETKGGTGEVILEIQAE